MSAAGLADSWSLDHVGYVGRALEPLRVAMQRLGFAPTRPRLLMSEDPATGARVSLRQESCHVVLGEGYLELSAVLTEDPSHHLAAYVARGEGLHILALGHCDVDRAAQAAGVAGLRCTRPAFAARHIDYGTRHGDARFRWFMVEPADSPEGLLCVARNLTPELVYQPEVTCHPNGALALEEVLIRVDQLAPAAARYAALLGWPPQAAGHGACRFALRTGVLTLALPAVVAARLGSTAAHARPGAFAAIRIRVAELVAARRLLERAGVGFDEVDGGLVIAPPAAGGAALVLSG